MVLVLNPRIIPSEKFFLYELGKNSREVPMNINHIPYKELYYNRKRKGKHLSIYTSDELFYLGYTPLNFGKGEMFRNVVRILLKNPKEFRHISEMRDQNLSRDYIKLEKRGISLFLPANYNLKFNS